MQVDNFQSLVLRSFFSVIMVENYTKNYVSPQFLVTSWNVKFWHFWAPHYGPFPPLGLSKASLIVWCHISCVKCLLLQHICPGQPHNIPDLLLSMHLTNWILANWRDEKFPAKVHLFQVTRFSWNIDILHIKSMGSILYNHSLEVDITIAKCIKRSYHPLPLLQIACLIILAELDLVALSLMTNNASGPWWCASLQTSC